VNELEGTRRKVGIFRQVCSQLPELGLRRRQWKMQPFSVPFDMYHSEEWMFGLARKYAAQKEVDHAKEAESRPGGIYPPSA